MRRSDGSSRRSTQPFFSKLLMRLVRQALSLAVCSARYCWLTPGFFHRRCITWSISNVMSTLLDFNTLCMVWRKVIRVFRIWSINSCAASLFAIAVYFYGTKVGNILEILVKCLTVSFSEYAVSIHPACSLVPKRTYCRAFGYILRASWPFAASPALRRDRGSFPRSGF